MEVKATPFWKLQTRKQFGLDLGFTFTEFDYLASGPFWQLQLDLVFVRVYLNLTN